MPLELEQAHLKLKRGSLYKYKSLQGEAFEHSREILVENKIFCSRPSQLNDPAECKPILTIGDIDDPEYRPRIDAWVRRCLAQRVPQPSEEEIQQELNQLEQLSLERMIADATQEFQQEVDDRYFVFSLSDTAVNQHLWEMYADDYQGVCFEFFLDPLFGTAFKINYADEIPAIDITNNENMDHLVMTALVKHVQWAKEREYRLIFSDPPLPDDPPLENQRYTFPPNQLTAIILGHNIVKEHQDELMKLIKDRNPVPRCLIASPVPGSTNVQLQGFPIE